MAVAAETHMKMTAAVVTKKRGSRMNDEEAVVGTCNPELKKQLLRRRCRYRIRDYRFQVWIGIGWRRANIEDPGDSVVLKYSTEW